MSAVTDRARRDAAKAKNRKKSQRKSVKNPALNSMGEPWWTSADLSVENLVLQSVVAKAAANSKKKAKAQKGRASAKKPKTRKEKAKANKKPKVPELNRQKMALNIARSLTDSGVEQSIEDGVSTLTITFLDADDAVAQSGIFDQDQNGKLDPIDVKLSLWYYRLVKVSKNDSLYTLTFEDRLVSYLRQHSSFKWVSRYDRTRAQFIGSLVKEVKAKRIKFYCPELNQIQPIGATDKKSGTKTKITVATTQDSDSYESSKSVSLNGKEGKLGADQIRNARKVLQICKNNKAPAKAVLATVEACIVEAPDFKNPTDGEGTSVGILQLTDDHYGGSVSQRRDIERVVTQFLRGPGFTGSKGAIALAKAHPTWSAGKIAQTIQGSGHPFRYDGEKERAKRIIEVLGEGMRASTTTTNVSTTTTKRRQFRFSRGTKGKPEDSWTCIQRLAKDVNWRAFVRGGALWYVSEDWLLAQEPAVVIDENTRWVNSLNYDIDNMKAVQSVTMVCRASRWGLFPGTTIAIAIPGGAYGRWIVSKVSRKLTDRTTTVVLTKKTPKKVEPAPQTKTTTKTASNSSSTGDGSTSGNANVDAAYKKAEAISGKNYPYVWGGGHQVLGQPNGGGYDCSGYTGAILKAGDMNGSKSPQVSGWYAANWGRPGKGKLMTVWANGEHVFVEFYGRRGKRADTSPHGSGGSGPHMRYKTRSTAGFTPRHWPGT